MAKAGTLKCDDGLAGWKNHATVGLIPQILHQVKRAIDGLKTQLRIL